MARLAVLALLIAGCGGSDDRRGTPRTPDPALTLTRELPPEYVRRVCGELAEDAPPDARTCPPLIPAGPLEVTHANRFAEREPYRGGFSAHLASRSIKRLRRTRIETNGGHWHFGVAWTPIVTRLLVRRGVEDVASRCRHVDLAGARMKACRVKPYERGGGVHGGHVVYVWTTGRTTRLVSLHGYANEPRVRAMAAAWRRAAG